MTTAHPLAPAANLPADLERNKSQAAMAVEQALAPVQPPERNEPGIELRGPIARLPVEMDVSVPVREFRVRGLLALEAGHLIESGWAHGGDVPLAAGRVQLAWCEFEVIETSLAVRLTRMV